MVMLSCSQHMSCFNFHLNKVSLNQAEVRTSDVSLQLSSQPPFRSDAKRHHTEHDAV